MAAFALCAPRLSRLASFCYATRQDRFYDKVIVVLHWLLEWAETVWRPWFFS